jgi:ABC-type phosphate transport system permease subunit
VATAKIPNDSEKKFFYRKLLRLLEIPSITAAVLCFASNIVFLLYLQLHRPTSPNEVLGYVVYKKAIGIPFYVTQLESNISRILIICFVIFLCLIIVSRRFREK